MKLRRSALLWFASLGAIAASPAFSQIVPMGVPAPAPVTKTPKPKSVAPDAPVPGNPDFQADQPAAPVPPPLPPAMWDIASAQELLAYIQQIGVRGAQPRRLRRRGPRGGDPDRQSGDCLAGCDPALQHGLVGPRAGAREEGRSNGLVPGRQGPRLGEAGCVAARRARTAQSHRRAERTASDASAICRAQGRARRDRAERRGKARPHPSQPRTLALAAARPRREVHHRQRAGISRDSRREWRQSMEASRDRRQAVDANAAAQRAGDGRDPQSLVGSPEEHRERSRGKEGIRARERCRRQDFSAGASRRDRPTHLAN